MTNWDLKSLFQKAGWQIILLLIALCWLWNTAYETDQAEFDRLFLHQYVEGQVKCYAKSDTTCELQVTIGYWARTEKCAPWNRHYTERIFEAENFGDYRHPLPTNLSGDFKGCSISGSTYFVPIEYFYAKEEDEYKLYRIVELLAEQDKEVCNKHSSHALYEVTIRRNGLKLYAILEEVDRSKVNFSPSVYYSQPFSVKGDDSLIMSTSIEKPKMLGYFSTKKGGEK